MNKLPDKILGSNMYPTLNVFGGVTESLDEYTQAFVDFCKFDTQKVLDIGVGYGFSSLAALKKGVHLIANDLDQRHLDIFLTNVPKELQKNLILKAGHFPDELDFEEKSFDAIHAARILHFLMPDKLCEGLAKIASWLKPNAKVFLTTESPYIRQQEKLLSVEYEQNLQQKKEWPGVIMDFRNRYCTPKFRHLCQKDLHLLEPVIFRRECEKVGLCVEKTSLFARPDLPEQVRYDGREGAGIIAIKKQK